MKFIKRWLLKIGLKKITKQFDKMDKSKNTTLTGILGALAIFATQIGYLVDADPATTFSVEAIIGALTLLGLGWFARDKNVSSEEQKGG